MTEPAPAIPADEVLYDGRFLQAVRREHWEFVRRKNTSGIVILVALTDADELLLVEQFRTPVGTRVIELPAGLAGDIAGEEDEPLQRAAARELEEETGFRPGRIVPLTHGPVSAGLTSEVVTFFRALDLVRVSDGGGDEHEDIVVHRIPRPEVHAFLVARQAEGLHVDPKVYAALWFIANP